MKSTLPQKTGCLLAACFPLLCGSSAFAENRDADYDAIRSGVTWFDDRGKVVDAHGAGIIKDNGRYYLFGEDQIDASDAFEAFNCYSSADLANWRFENQVLKAQPSGILGPNRLGQRVKVMKCPSTGEYVMFMHCDNLTYTDQSVGYATSPTINGNYSLKGQLQYNGSPIRMWDMGTFQDTDGSGYLLTHEGNVYKLANDYRSVASQVTSNFAGGSESPAVFKSGNTYFWLGSNKTMWERNDDFYYTATSLAGPWTKRGLFAPSGTLTWNSQVTFVLPVAGAKGTTYMYMGDRWSYPLQGTAATYVWQPLTVSGTALSMPSYYEAWRIDTATGLYGTLRSAESSVDDDNYGTGTNQIEYTGNWTHAAGASGGTESKSDAKGSALRVKFTGTQIKMLGAADNKGGYAQAAILDSANDTVFSTTIDFYCKFRDADNQSKFASPRLPYGTYTFALTVLGQHGVWHDKAGTIYGSTADFVYVDRFSISSPTEANVFEAENATLYNAIPQSANAGFSGTGYAHFNNEAGAYAEMDFRVSGSGGKNVKITFANGAAAARPTSVSVNGSVVLKALDFRATGGWAKWDTADIPLVLDKGVNTLRFTALASDGGPDIDKVEIGSPASPIAAPHQGENPGFSFDPGSLIIQAHCPGKVIRIELYGINGMKVFGENLFPGPDNVRFKLPVNGLEKGRYFLKMSAGGSSEIREFDLIR